MPQDSHIPFYHTTIRRKLQEVFKIFLRKLCGVKFPSKCNSMLLLRLIGKITHLPSCGRIDLPLPSPAGAACLLCRPPALPLACFVAPVPPAPFPAGRGSPKVYFAGGEAPGTPALNRLRHLQNLPSGCPAHGSLRFGAKPKEPPFHGQCRQPRRGGTGGDGTIRRKRRRRLRRPSPPGQGEQVPLGFSPPVGHHSGKVGRRPTGQVPRRVHV